MASILAAAGAPPPPPPPPHKKRGPPSQFISNREEEEEEEEEEDRDQPEFIQELPRVSKRKTSFIWQFFSIPPGDKKVNAKYATCLICKYRLSRGTEKKYSMGNYTMHRHMARWHPLNYSRAELRDLQDNPPTTPVPRSTSTMSLTGREAQETVPNIQPNFKHIKFTCIYCGAMLSYGNMSVNLINMVFENHKCPNAPKQ